eukprot:gene6403-10410_t
MDFLNHEVLDVLDKFSFFFGLISPLFHYLILIFFLISILQIFQTKYELDHRLNHEANKPWQLQKIFQKKGYYLNFEEQDNAYATRSGHIILGVKSDRGFWDKFFGSSGWTEEERTSLLNHEIGHVKMGLFFTYFEAYTLVFGLTMFDELTGDLFNQISTLIKCSIQMKLAMDPLNLLSNWLDELVADSNSGSNMLHFFDFVEKDLNLEGILYKLFGGKDHPPIWLRRLFLSFPYNINLIDIALVILFIYQIQKRNFLSIQITFVICSMLWLSRIGIFQWYIQFPLILLLDYYLRNFVHQF